MNSSHYEESFDFEESGFNGDDADDILNVVISEQEIYTAIRNLKSGKSAGFDGVLNEYYKMHTKYPHATIFQTFKHYFRNRYST